jgi:hypothetical protein
MRTLARSAVVVFTIVALAMVGCGPLSSDSSDTTRAIVVDYSAAFAGQTSTGYLNLVVDMTIENRGYESFTASPDVFAIAVDEYAYRASESDMQPVDLLDGEQMRGRLLFQVPAIAASTRVGYELTYSGESDYRFEWLKQTAAAVAATGPEILITYTGAYMWVPPESQMYLLLDITIENRGYESFNTAPGRFTLVMGEIFGETGSRPPIGYDGEFSDERDEAFTDLRSYDLQNGGTLSGKIAYRVPKDILAMTESYRIEYSGVRAYNIRWQYVAPPEEQSQRRIRPQ